MVATTVRRFLTAAAFAAILVAVLSVLHADALAPVIDLSAGGADVAIVGADAYDAVGSAAVVGDVNGDGTGDLIVSTTGGDGPGTGSLTLCNSIVPGDRCDSGEVYIIYSAGTRLNDLDLDIEAANVTIFAEQSMDLFGYSLASGDVNGDGIDDVIIGAPTASDEYTQQGKTYVIYGSPTLPPSIDLTAGGGDLTILGPGPGYSLGTALATADVNDDGFDDVISGAFYGYSVYVTYGGVSLPSMVELQTNADLKVYTTGPDYLGLDLATGDINGDLIDDLIVGAPHGSGNATMPGRTFVIYGSTTLPTAIDLSAGAGFNADVTVIGDDGQDQLGEAVASGDVNGDSVDDVIMGAPNSDGPGVGSCEAPGNGDRCGAGDTYVLYGGGALSSVINLQDTPADLVIYGGSMGDQSGKKLKAGDFTNDGIDDIAIGAMFADPPAGSNLGKTFVVAGSAALPSSIDLSTSADSDIHSDVLARLIGAGDISGDGVDDILVRTFQDEPARPGADRTHVIRGDSPMMAYPGDTDGDGCPDLREPGANQQVGGQRDWNNANDYFNPSHDGENRIDDVVLVVHAYFKDDTDGSPGLPPYTAGYNPDTDRLLPMGAPHPWSLQGPNGLQRVDDVVNIVKQYYHDCD